MKKQDLKNGMRVKVRCGIDNDPMYMVMGNKLLRMRGYIPMSRYRDDLTMSSEYPTDDFDIMEVYEDSYCDLDPNNYGKLLWKREESL